MRWGRRRLMVVVVALALLTPLVLGAGVAAQPENETTTTNTTTTTASAGSEWEAPGPFTLADLTTGGTKDADAPKASRSIGTGGVLLRYKPVSPLQNEYKPLSGLVEADRIQVFSNAYLEATGEYTFVIVHWQKATKQVNGTQVAYAAEQEVQRVTVDLESGYSTQLIQLNPEYNSSEQVTMWLERDGERVEGARWRFTHRSNPLTQAPSYPVDSQGDLWRWAALYIFLPALPGIFIARHNANHILERTVVAAQKSMGWWFLLIGGVGLLVVTVATWQTAAVLARIPIVAGLSFYLVALFAMLGLKDPDIERAEFRQKNLVDTTTVKGEAGKKAKHIRVKLLSIVRRNNKIYAPKAGFRPMFARYFAEPAEVAEDELKTVTNATGDISKHYELDPGLDEDEVLVHTPARLAFNPQVFVEREGEEPVMSVDVDEETHPAVATVQAVPAAIVNTVGGLLGAINWRFVGTAVVGGAAAYYGIMALVGVPSLAILLGLLPGVIAGYEAVDGELRAELAPEHYEDADAILAIDRDSYKQAATFDGLQKVVADMDMDEHERVQDFIEAFWDRMTERFDRIQGPSRPASGPDKPALKGDD